MPIRVQSRNRHLFRLSPDVAVLYGRALSIAHEIHISGKDGDVLVARIQADQQAVSKFCALERMAWRDPAGESPKGWPIEFVARPNIESALPLATTLHAMNIPQP